MGISSFTPKTERSNGSYRDASVKVYIHGFRPVRIRAVYQRPGPLSRERVGRSRLWACCSRSRLEMIVAPVSRVLGSPSLICRDAFSACVPRFDLAPRAKNSSYPSHVDGSLAQDRVHPFEAARLHLQCPFEQADQLRAQFVANCLCSFAFGSFRLDSRQGSEGSTDLRQPLVEFARRDWAFGTGRSHRGPWYPGAASVLLQSWSPSILGRSGALHSLQRSFAL